MFCEAISVMISKTMRNHDYRVEEQIYRQVEGGSIGMDLTGVVADIYMIEWDKKLLRKMEENLIVVKVYKRYKDDVNLILDIDDTQIIYDNDKIREEETMKCVKSLADEIDPALKVTADFSKNHDDGKLPVLDLKVWIGENKNGETKILYTHL